jgi:ABC-2 type transport system ATP-binding protein
MDSLLRNEHVSLASPKGTVAAMPTSREPVVEFQEVIKEYAAPFPRRERLRAVDRVSFTVNPGEIVGLLGPNRAGKTTLVKLLLSLCRPTQGQVFRFGLPSSRRETLGRMGYVHERPAFPVYLSAREVLDYHAVLAGVGRRERALRIPAMLDRVGLSDRTREPVAQFSKGMLQRLGLAQALINEPAFLVLDEPYEGLDLGGRRLVGELLEERRREGNSALIVSHVIPAIEAHCDRAVILVGGRVVHRETLAATADADQVVLGDTVVLETLKGLHRPRRSLEASLAEFSGIIHP